MCSVARKIIVGVSGGVDSAVAACILKKRGFNVEGLFMKNWDVTDETGKCTSDVDLEDARYVCQHLDIPFHEVNFVKEYWNGVFSDMIKGYENGTTPNPDILCNKLIKFDAFFKHAIERLGADGIATGHYARTSHGYDLASVDPLEGTSLLMPADSLKDQTFFLSQISQEALQKSIFPIGDLAKEYVKKIAMSEGMRRIANRKESMGICFIGSRNFQQFIEQYIEPKEGRFIHLESGDVVGHHKGTHFWTIGQRTLIEGQNKALFVAEIRPQTQDIFVAPGTNHPALFCQSFFTEPAHWIRRPPEQLLEEDVLDVSFRYQHSYPPVKCSATLSDGQRLVVSFNQPMRAISAGQYVAFYQGSECLGSAKIIRPGPSLHTLNCGSRLNLPKPLT